MKTSTSRPLCFILGAGACLVPLHHLTAATWDGGAGTSKWQDASNWSNDSVPAGTETALVNSSVAIAYDSSTGFTTTGQLQIGAAASVNASVNLTSAAGTLVFGGDLTLLGTSITTIELTDSAFGVDSFDLALGGAGSQPVAFDGILNLLFDFGETYTNGSSVKIFDFEGYSGDFGTVNFSGLGEGQTASFNASTGIATIVPEPSCALLGGAGVLLLLRRKRQPA